MTRKKRKRKEERRAAGDASQRPVEDIDAMRAACRLAAELLDLIEPEIRPGITTADIDRMVEEQTRARGGVSAPYGYRGFPAHCCTSINDVVCHGIPDPERVLREGDIINVDVTPIVKGYHGDTSRTFLIGDGGADGAPPGRGHLRVAVARHRRGAPRRHHRRHRPRHPELRRAARLLGGPPVLRPRHRSHLPHRAGGPALRPAGHRRAPSPRHDVHDRADDQPRRLALSASSTTAGPR